MTVRIETTLRLENDSKPAGKEWWEWSIWVDGSREDLEQVESVTYRLHPTFPKPVVTVDTPENKFRFSSAGWGEFSISADAHLKDGRTVHLERWLTLEHHALKSTSPKMPQVYLSYSIADTGLAQQLTAALEKQGISVCTAEDTLAASDEVAPQLGKVVGSATAVIAVVSEPPSRFVEQEALHAWKNGRFVLPVVVGKAKVDTKLSSLPRFELPDTGLVEGLTNQIVARIKDATIPDEL